MIFYTPLCNKLKIKKELGHKEYIKGIEPGEALDPDWI